MAIAGTPLAIETLNVSGKWSSDLGGDVFLEQNGKQIVGTYQYINDDGIVKDGTIEGSITNNTINAKWLEYPARGRGKVGEEIHGDLEWTIIDNGNMLMGWYREDGEPDPHEEAQHEWNLER